MTTDVRRGRRRPYTLKAAVGYLATMAGLAAAIALPVVLVLASRELEERQSQLDIKDAEIERLKSENRQAVERERKLSAQYDLASATKNLGSEHPVTVMKAQSDESVGAPTGEASHGVFQPRGNTDSMDFEAKVQLLYEKVVGTESPDADSNSQGSDPRPTGLDEKVVRQDTTEPTAATGESR